MREERSLLIARSTVRKTVFSNGLTLVTERCPQYQSLAIGFWIKAGTRHEKASDAGVCHFLEHMLFKGTDTRDALEIAREVDCVGGDFNAFTTREYTCFHITLLAKDAKLAFDILNDVILNSDFDPNELERERKVILQEIAMVDDAPEELAQDLLFEKVYGRNGLGRPILGTLNSIRRMRRIDLLKFFRNHYRPHDLVISVSGNVSHQTVKKLIKPLLKKTKLWPGRTAKHKHVPKVSPKFKTGRWWEVKSSEQAHMVWAFPAPDFSSKDRYATYLLNTHLGVGMSSELFQEIREKKGLAYTVYSSHNPFEEVGLFMIYAATSPTQVLTCLKVIDEVLQKLKQELLSDELLQVAKDSVNGALLLQADSVETRMSNLATTEIYFKHILEINDVCKQIQAVTAHDIRRVARRIFHPGKDALLTLGPRPSRSVKKRYFKF